jgi:hypothetical protein
MISFEANKRIIKTRFIINRIGLPLAPEKIAANLTEWVKKLTDGVFRICHFVWQMETS